MMIRALGYLTRAICGAIMLVLVLLISLEVMLRFFFDLPIDWIVEIAVLLFIWMSMLGAAAAVPAAAHMVLRPLSGRLGPIGGKLLASFTAAAVIAFGFFLLISGLSYMQSLSGEVMPVSGIPSEWGAADFPTAGALMIIFGLQQAFVALRIGKGRTLVSPAPIPATNADASDQRRKMPC